MTVLRSRPFYIMVRATSSLPSFRPFSMPRCTPSWIPFSMPFCLSCCTMVMSASPYCGARCASSRKKAPALTFRLPVKYSVPAILPGLKTDIRPAEWGQACRPVQPGPADEYAFAAESGHSHTAMVRDFIIRNNCDIHQGKRGEIKVFRQCGIIELIKPSR